MAIPTPFTLRLELVQGTGNSIDPKALPPPGQIVAFSNQFPQLQSFASALSANKNLLLLVGGRNVGIHPLPPSLTPQPQVPDYFSYPYFFLIRYFSRGKTK